MAGQRSFRSKKHLRMTFIDNQPQQYQTQGYKSVNIPIKYSLLVSLLLLFSCITTKTSSPKNAGISEQKPVAKNVVLMIVDGMGFEHIKAARIYNGQKPFNYEQFTCKTKVSTCSFEGADAEGKCREGTSDITDSAAAATAMATGVKVKNGAISRGLPLYPGDLETLVEYKKHFGQSTGIVATKLFTDATPAAFVSHADDRHQTEEILKDMFYGAKPNLVLGADTTLHRVVAQSSKAPYRMVYTAPDLAILAQDIHKGPSCSGSNCPFVYGGFGLYDMIPGVYENKAGLPLEITPSSRFTELGIPHLSEMTDAALKILSKNDKGFFLMVESSMPDMISHYNTQIDGNEKAPKAIEVLIREMLEVEKTAQVLEKFARNNPDTLVIVTADHETGGLFVQEDKTTCLSEQSCVPEVRWTSPKYEDTESSASKHTPVDVPLYAFGRGAERFCQERINNTDIHDILVGR